MAREQMITKCMVRGAVAGFVATAPMSAAMLTMRRWLPWWQRGPLPPQKVTSDTLARLDLEYINDKHHKLATVVGHFLYGAAAGTVYPLIHRLPLPNPLKGILHGLVVWTASYMGWLPAAGLLQPATKRPLERNLLMIMAHVIWGLVTSWLFERSRPAH